VHPIWLLASGRIIGRLKMRGLEMTWVAILGPLWARALLMGSVMVVAAVLGTLVALRIPSLSEATAQAAGFLAAIFWILGIGLISYGALAGQRSRRR
jgi:hypothetical protein